MPNTAGMLAWARQRLQLMWERVGTLCRKLQAWCAATFRGNWWALRQGYFLQDRDLIEPTAWSEINEVGMIWWGSWTGTEGRDSICQYLFMAFTHGLPALVRVWVYEHTQLIAKETLFSFILTKKLQLTSRANFQIVFLSFFFFFPYMIKRNFRMMSCTQMKAKFDVLKW